MREEGSSTALDAKNLLAMIHRLKSDLVFPKEAKSAFRNPELGEQVTEIYEAYETLLGKHNALDFDSLILRTHQLFDEFPVFAARVQEVYPFVCIDEFQDTNLSQYRVSRCLASTERNNLFAVADDDQIIYQRNGASHERIKQFVADFKPAILQLPVNYRCPAEIVQLANDLIQHNFLRSSNKQPAIAYLATQKGNVVRLLGGFRNEKRKRQKPWLRITEAAPTSKKRTGLGSHVSALDAARATGFFRRIAESGSRVPASSEPVLRPFVALAVSDDSRNRGGAHIKKADRFGFARVGTGCGARDGFFPEDR